MKLGRLFIFFLAMMFLLPVTAEAQQRYYKAVVEGWLYGTEVKFKERLLFIVEKECPENFACQIALPRDVTKISWPGGAFFLNIGDGRNKDVPYVRLWTDIYRFDSEIYTFNLDLDQYPDTKVVKEGEYSVKAKFFKNNQPVYAQILTHYTKSFTDNHGLKLKIIINPPE